MAITISDADNNQLTWDDSTQTFTKADAEGIIIETRPYNDAELAQASSRTSDTTAEGNKKTVVDALLAGLNDLQTLIDTPNSTINAGPAPYIKALARLLRRIIRYSLARFDGTS